MVDVVIVGTDGLELTLSGTEAVVVGVLTE